MGMTIEDCINKLIAKEKCMSRETSGIDTDCNLHNCDNCDLCYEQGTMGEQKEALKFAVETMRKYQQLEDFARWVAVEVIDEELWTYNYLAFAELACRKLVKLGIMQGSDGEYSYEVVADGNDD
jgi:hypothetical protein